VVHLSACGKVARGLRTLSLDDGQLSLTDDAAQEMFELLYDRGELASEREITSCRQLLIRPDRRYSASDSSAAAPCSARNESTLVRGSGVAGGFCLTGLTKFLADPVSVGPRTGQHSK
jgi:hypothetical protein